MGKSEPMTALDPVEDLIAEMGCTRRCIGALLDVVATLRAGREPAVRQQSPGYVRARPGTR